MKEAGFYSAIKAMWLVIDSVLSRGFQDRAPRLIVGCSSFVSLHFKIIVVLGPSCEPDAFDFAGVQFETH